MVLLEINPNHQRDSGIRQDPVQMDRTAAEMLIGRVLLRDLEMPRQPKVELVEGNWNEGRTLRRGTR